MTVAQSLPPLPPLFRVVLSSETGDKRAMAAVDRQKLLEIVKAALPGILEAHPGKDPDSVASILLRDAAEELRPFHNDGTFREAVNSGDWHALNGIANIAGALVLMENATVCAFEFDYGDQVCFRLVHDDRLFDAIGAKHHMPIELLRQINDFTGGTNEIKYAEFTLLAPARDVAEALQLMAEQPQRERVVTSIIAELEKDARRIRKTGRASRKVGKRFYDNAVLWFADQQLRLN